MDTITQGVDMTANPKNKVMDAYAHLFETTGAGDWIEIHKPAEEVDLVKTEPGDGWPTFQEIMAQVPEGPAKESVKELRGIVRRTPIRVCWEEHESLPLVLVCPWGWRKKNLDIHKRAYGLLLFRGAGEVIEAYMWNLLPTPEEVEGEPWGRA